MSASPAAGTVGAPGPGQASGAAVAGGPTPGRAAAAARGIPLPTIIATVVVLALAYLAGKVLYRPRDVILLMFVGPQWRDVAANCNVGAYMRGQIFRCLYLHHYTA